MSAPARLQIYRFGADSAFEGGVAGAVERLEAGSDRQLLDALFVARDAAAGELQAVDLATARADGTLAALLDFRLDLGRRRAMTRRTLATDAASREVLAAIARVLEPGGAMLVLLLAGSPPDELGDTLARAGGRLVADDAVSAQRLADVAPALSARL